MQPALNYGFHQSRSGMRGSSRGCPGPNRPPDENVMKFWLIWVDGYRVDMAASPVKLDQVAA
jgi:hypothetical protein